MSPSYLVLAVVAFLASACQAADGNCNPDNPPTVISTDNTVIKSVNYDNAGTYPPDATCEWLFDMPAGEFTALSAVFTDFYVPFCPDCGCDRVTLFDGADDTAPVIAVLCSSDAAGVYQASGNQMFMRFETAGGPGGDGWRAVVNFDRWDDNACSTTASITADSGWFASPNYPLEYENRLDCFWEITAPGGPDWRVQMRVEDFQTEGASDCQVSDFIVLYDGNSQTDDDLARLYGVVSPGNFAYEGYESNTMLVYFRSNIAINHRGFNMSWTTVNRA